MPVPYLKVSAANIKAAVKILLNNDQLEEAEDYLKLLRQLESVITVTELRISAENELRISAEKACDLTAEEVALVKARDIIPAIKSVKFRTGCGLKEAKDLVEDYVAKHRP